MPPAKHRFGKFDRQSVTDGRTYRRTTDKVIPMRRNASQATQKVGSSVGSGVCCPLAADGNFARQISLPTTSLYGNSGQLSGQPTTSK